MPTPATGIVTIGGVDCTIVEDGNGEGCIERLGPDGGSATVKIKCPWNQRNPVMIGLRGTSRFSGGQVVRVPPFAYPPAPWLRCLSIDEIKGIHPYWDASLGWIAYEKALMTLQFGTVSWNWDGIDPNNPNRAPYTTFKYKVSAEIQPNPGGAYYNIDSGKPIEEHAFGLVRPLCEISMIRHWMPYVPLNAVMTYISTVNATAIQVEDRVFDRGSLLFLGMNTTPEEDAEGNHVHEVEYVFAGRHSSEWNEIIDRDGLLHLINTNPAGTGNFPFEYVDFLNQLP
jgi:hypothetical protein